MSNTRILNLVSIFKPGFLVKTQTIRANSSLSNQENKWYFASSNNLCAVRSREFTSNNRQLKSEMMEWPKITLFGDSITRRSMDPDNGCWGSMIAYKVGSYIDVDARGFEGYNTKLSLELMPKLFPKSYLDKVEIFIPFFGHNDSWDSEFLAVKPEDFESNMRKIIRYLIDNGLNKNKIILITPTWYHEEDFNAYMRELNYPPTGKSLEHATKYSDAVFRIAKDEALDVIDFFNVSKMHEPLKSMFCDGVHYSRLGAKMLFNLLMPLIEKKLESRFGKPLIDLWHVCPLDKLEQAQEYFLKHRSSSGNKV